MKQTQIQKPYANAEIQTILIFYTSGCEYHRYHEHLLSIYWFLFKL